MPLPAQPGMAVLPMCSTFDHGAAASISAAARAAAPIAPGSYSTYAVCEFEYGKICGVRVTRDHRLSRLRTEADASCAPLLPSFSGADCNPYTSGVCTTGTRCNVALADPGLDPGDARERVLRLRSDSLR